jgi:hypothetical protein
MGIGDRLMHHIDTHSLLSKSLGILDLSVALLDLLTVDRWCDLDTILVAEPTWDFGSGIWIGTTYL